MIRKTLTIFLIVLVALSTSSCMNIVEKLFFRANGSGTYQMTVDMSGMAEMIKSFGGTEDDMAESLNEAESEFSSVVDKLEAIDGISNVTQNSDKENLTFSIQYDFANVKALNMALSENYHDEETDGPEVIQKTFYKRSKNTIVRTSVDPMLEAMDELEGQDMMGMETFFKDMYYDFIMEFDRDIKSVSNEDYASEGKRSVNLRRYFFKTEDQKKQVEVEVKTK